MRVLLPVLLLLLSGCTEERRPVPVPHDKLVAVLADIHLAEGAMQEITVAKRDSLLDLYYERITALHGVDEEEFMRSLEMLRRRPEELSVIYAEVGEVLSVRDAENESRDRE